MSNTRQQYEQRPIVRLKRYIKNTDPEYVKKRKIYSNKEDVKERRKTLNKRRRILSTALINMAKSNKLSTTEQEPLTVIRGRLCNTKGEIIYAKKNGDIEKVQYTNELALEDSKYDLAENSAHDDEFDKLLGAYTKYLSENNLKIEDKNNLEQFLKELKDGASGNPRPTDSGIQHPSTPTREDGECSSDDE